MLCAHSAAKVGIPGCPAMAGSAPFPFWGMPLPCAEAILGVSGQDTAGAPGPSCLRCPGKPKRAPDDQPDEPALSHASARRDAVRHGEIALRSIGEPNSVASQFDFWDNQYEGRRLSSEL